MRKLITILIAIFCISNLYALEKDNAKLSAQDNLNVSESSMTFGDRDSLVKYFDITTNSAWQINTYSNEKIKIDTLNGIGNRTIKIILDTNTTAIPMESYISIATVDTNIDINIYQFRNSSFIDLEVKKIILSKPLDSAIINEPIKLNVLVQNKCKVPQSQFPLSFELLDCSTGKVNVVLYGFYYKTLQPDSTASIDLGSFSLFKNGKYSLKAFIGRFDDDIPNNTLAINCNAPDSSKASIDTELLNTSNIFPNPTDGLINIYSESAIEKIQVIDILGRLVQESSPNETTTKLMITSPGIYFVRIGSQNNYKTTKIEVFK